MKLGILICDDVRPEFVEEHGQYPDMFYNVLRKAIPNLETIGYDVQKGIYPKDIDEVDAYLVTGSFMSVYEDVPWVNELKKFIVKLHSVKKKITGACFAHQLIAESLGGKTLKSTKGWGIGVHTHKVTEQGKELFGEREDFNIVVSHQDQVTKLPEGAEVLASSDFCEVAAMKIGDHIFTVQGHPEFSTSYSGELIKMRKHLYTQEFVDAGMASLQLKPDDLLLAKAIKKFLSS